MIKTRPADPLFREEAPLGAANHTLFLGDGCWVRVSSMGDSIEVSVATSPDGPPLAVTELADSFGDSQVGLHAHPLPGHAVVWISAGQDGTESWLVSYDAKITAVRLPADDCGPARFGSSGRWFLATDDLTLRRISWPDGAELGALDWPEEFGEDEPGTDVQVLPGGYACWPSENGRLHLVDLATMELVEEVCLADHPVRTVGEIFPRLAGDETPCSDLDTARIVCIDRVDWFIAGHRGGDITASRAGEMSPQPTRAFS